MITLYTGAGNLCACKNSCSADLKLSSGRLFSAALSDFSLRTVRSTKPRAAAIPPSRYIAAMSASSASSSKPFLLRPPLASSLGPRIRWEPRSRCCATATKLPAQTKKDFNFVNCPSGACGKVATKCSLTKKPKIASPRNSNLS